VTGEIHAPATLSWKKSLQDLLSRWRGDTRSGLDT